MRKKNYSWQVFRLRASAESLGVVTAPDEDAALERAIEAFSIMLVHHQKALWCGVRTRSTTIDGRCRCAAFVFADCRGTYKHIRFRNVLRILCKAAYPKIKDTSRSPRVQPARDERKQTPARVPGSTTHIETKALVELSRCIAPIRQAPKDLVWRLATHDEIEVAKLVLTQSARLRSEHLVEIAKAKSQDHLLAMSARFELNPDLADILIERGDRKVKRGPVRTFKRLAKL